jgi:tellurite resistance protein TerC
MEQKTLLWIGFNILVLILLFIDLGAFHRKDHVIKVKEALLMSGVWILLAILFNTGIYFWFGKESALQFFAGFLLEKSLSVDNIFVFILIFSYFKIPPKYQYHVLFWGILGALVLRAGFILAGTSLIKQFHWIIYIFGGILVYTGIKMALQKEEDEIEPDKNFLVRLVKRLMPVTKDYGEGKLFVKRQGRYHASLLFIALLVVETTDVVFALDSIPAIFAVTTDPFIVYTSNVFAILGLRALYFALAGIMDLFHYLKLGLSVILTFVGIKMLISETYHIPIEAALGFIAGILIISILASIIWPRKPEEKVEDLTNNQNNPLNMEAKDEG